MTDGRLERALSEAIADLAGTNAPDYLDDILERTERTRQRPWWTFPGRYAAMTPTLKFATAAGVAFALGIGASMLILPRADEPGIVPAAAEPSPTPDAGFVLPFPHSEFTAEWQLGDRVPNVGDVPTTGMRYEFSVVSTSEPRFDGEVIGTIRYPALPGWPSWIGVFEVEDEVGTWTSDALLHLEFEDTSASTGTVVFTGGGEYQGQFAIAEMTLLPDETLTVHGVISGVPVADPPDIATAGA